MKAIYVCWIDANVSPGWQKVPNENVGISRIDTIGFLINEDDRQINIALSHIVGYESSFGDIISIPKVAIVKRCYLQLPKRLRDHIVDDNKMMV